VVAFAPHIKRPVPREVPATQQRFLLQQFWTTKPAPDLQTRDSNRLPPRLR
jgi:hypothetical protein